jgi:hypothetical protein
MCYKDTGNKNGKVSRKKMSKFWQYFPVKAQAINNLLSSPIAFFGGRTSNRGICPFIEWFVILSAFL